MFARCSFATVTTIAHPAIGGGLVIVIAVTRVLVMVAGMIVIVALARMLKDLVFAVDVRITRASMMKCAPQNRVQQHRCDGEKLARGVHVENPCTCVI